MPVYWECPSHRNTHKEPPGAMGGMELALPTLDWGHSVCRGASHHWLPETEYQSVPSAHLRVPELPGVSATVRGSWVRQSPFLGWCELGCKDV